MLTAKPPPPPEFVKRWLNIKKELRKKKLTTARLHQRTSIEEKRMIVHLTTFPSPFPLYENVVSQDRETDFTTAYNG